MGGNEDGHLVLAGQIDHQLPEDIPGDRVHARGRFIEDQQLGLVHHGHGQRQPLADAQRQVLGQAVEHLAQAEALDHVVHPRRNGGLGHLEQARVQDQVLPHGEFAIQREGLGHVAHPAAGVDILGIHGLAEQPGFAFAGRQQSGEHLHGGRLAAAVGAQETEDLAPADPEGDVVHRQEITEAHGQPPGLDGDLGIGRRHQRRHHHRMMAVADRLGQQGDEGLLQRGGGGTGVQFLRGARGQHLARIHGHQPVEAVGLLHVGGGDHHAHGLALLADVIDQVPELPARKRVHPRGRLVQDQQVGVVDQGAAQAQLLFHPARKHARGAGQEALQPRAAGQLVDAAAPSRRVLAEQPAEELQVFFHRQRRVEVPAQALRHVGNARAHADPVGGAGHVATQDLQAAPLQDPSASQQR